MYVDAVAYTHTLYKHVGVHITGNCSGWVQAMMEYHMVQKIRKTTRLPPLLLPSQICQSFPSSAFFVLLCFNDTRIHFQEHFLIETCAVPWLRNIYLNFESWFPRPWCDDVSSIRKILGVGKNGGFHPFFEEVNLYPTLSGASVASLHSVTCVWRSSWFFQKHRNRYRSTDAQAWQSWCELRGGVIDTGRESHSR